MISAVVPSSTIEFDRFDVNVRFNLLSEVETVRRGTYHFDEPGRSFFLEIRSLQEASSPCRQLAIAGCWFAQLGGKHAEERSPAVVVTREIHTNCFCH